MSPHINHELVDALEEATKVEQENEEICHRTYYYYALHVFNRDKLTTYENFKNHGMESAHPMIDEYKGLFLSPQGDYHQAVGAKQSWLHELATTQIQNFKAQKEIKP